MEQQIINVVFGLAGALGGWWLKVIWESIKDLQRTDSNLAKEVSQLNILVAGQYVKQEMFDRFQDAIFSKLDRIEEKLDKKQDKE
jgi:hypothetical protein